MLNIKKIKSTETIFEKKITKKTRKKNHVGNTIAIQSVLWGKLQCFPHMIKLYYKVKF